MENKPYVWRKGQALHRTGFIGHISWRQHIAFPFKISKSRSVTTIQSFIIPVSSDYRALLCLAMGITGYLNNSYKISVELCKYNWGKRYICSVLEMTFRAGGDPCRFPVAATVHPNQERRRRPLTYHQTEEKPVEKVKKYPALHYHEQWSDEIIVLNYTWRIHTYISVQTQIRTILFF